MKKWGLVIGWILIVAMLMACTPAQQSSTTQPATEPMTEAPQPGYAITPHRAID